MHTEYWLTDFNYSSRLFYFFNFMKYHNSNLQLYLLLFVRLLLKFWNFETKENHNNYARNNDRSKGSSEILKGREKNRYRAQMRNEQSTCPHLASSSTWMELIAGLNVGIVRKKKKVKGKATCRQKLSPVCKREGGVKRGEAALTLAMTSFSYTVAPRNTGVDFSAKERMKRGNCTRKFTRPNRWDNGRI